MRLAVIFEIAGVFLSPLVLSPQASAADITLLAVGASQETVEDLIPTFEQSSGHKVVASYNGSAGIKQKLAAGEVFDLVILGAQEIDAFIQKGKLVTGSRTDLMKSAVGAGIRAGAPKLDIGSVDALKRTLLAARTIGYSTGPSGDHLVSLAARMGIADEVRPKLKQVPTGVRISTMIASGEAEIGFQQVSELIHAPGVDFLGSLPPELQKITVYSIGLHTGARQPEAAKAFIRFLVGPEAAEAIRKHGMDPG